MYLLWVCTVPAELNGVTFPRLPSGFWVSAARRDVSGELRKAEAKRQPSLLRVGRLALGIAAASARVAGLLCRVVGAELWPVP